MLFPEDLINLGAIQSERGKYEDAERYYRDALVITEGWFGMDHHQTASNDAWALGVSTAIRRGGDAAPEEAAKYRAEPATP